ncbi:acid-sensing ion channel 5-like [Mytilus edulis]|uniref:acid-sensing ion channel 5-like n=1 Tax=Mytilus edulis TaxID=6550 RepID=UPI0039F13FA4
MSTKSKDISTPSTEPLNTIGDLWNDFSQNTGFHGVNKLSGITSRHKIRLLLWTCFILSCGIYLIVTVVEEINNYYRYPTTMTQYTKPENEIEFPSVTICNLNSLNKSAIKNDSRIDNYYSNVSPFRGFSNITTNWSDPIYDQEGFYLNRTLEDVMTDEKNILDPGGFLVYATFHLSYLDVRKYFKVKLSHMGPCLTSNPDMKIKTNHVGSVFHLTLMLDLDSANNYYGSSYGEGLQFLVHDSKEDPIFEGNSGFYVEPGKEVFASVHKTRFEYLPSPYEAMGNEYCRDHMNNDGSQYYRSSCYKDCSSTFFLDRCNCLPYTHNSTYYCSKFQVANCILKAIGDYYNQTKLVDKCDCPLPCSSTHYDVSLTSSLFPSDFYSKKIFDLNRDKHLDYYRQNYIALHIYFDQLSTTVSQQVPKYSSAGDIFANLGGQMGLFLGASIVTLIELCEFLIYAFWTFLSNLRNRGTRVQKVAFK